MPSFAKYRLFSYPLPDPHSTAYHKLGIAPEATPGEIRMAKDKAKARLEKKRQNANAQLAEIYKQVPELQGLSKEVQELRLQGKGTDHKELNEKEKKLLRLEQQALSINASYKQLLETSTELDRKINDLNNLKLENPEARSNYDQETPPCALLKLEKYDQEIFTEPGRRLALFQLRLALSEFLEQKGEGCYHPSDLTRRDFLSDFTYNPFLDQNNDES